jgi:hypothetical protein
MDPHSRDDQHDRDRRSISMVPDEAPDPVETRDPHARPVPTRKGRAWLYAIPAVVLLVIGLAWMVQVERSSSGREGTREVAGTSGERANDPEGLPRGDAPLNPVASGPSVISDMELLTSKDEYVGRAVEIPAITVMSVPGPRTFWVGRLANRTLVLLDRQTQGATRVSPKQVLRVSGTLEAVPSASELARAGLTADDRDAVGGEEVIIRARRIEVQDDAGAHQATVPPDERH